MSATRCSRCDIDADVLGIRGDGTTAYVKFRCPQCGHLFSRAIGVVR